MTDPVSNRLPEAFGCGYSLQQMKFFIQLFLLMSFLLASAGTSAFSSESHCEDQARVEVAAGNQIKHTFKNVVEDHAHDCSDCSSACTTCRHQPALQAFLKQSSLIPPLLDKQLLIKRPLLFISKFSPSSLYRPPISILS